MPEGQRRLAAIVAADIAGYSRLIGADEEGTVAALQTYREEVVNPLLNQYHGRVANTAGDSFLIEFPSAVDAVRCAIEVQKRMAKRNESIADDRQILFRIGINVGDVIAQGDDLMGDGVNVAARIEGLADAGGIYFSHTVRDQIRDRIDVELEDLGDIGVKNIARPVRVFKVLTGDVVASKNGRSGANPKRLIPAIAAAVVLLAVIGGGAWWWQQLPKSTADKPSIAVLPFANLSNDQEQEYFADGMTDDLITDLSQVSSLTVISRNSVFTYKGKNVKVQEIASDLNVTHVIEGSVRRAGEEVRINAQLIDAKSGDHLWAETFDRDYKDIFKLQDEITGHIITAMKVQLTPTEKRKLAKAPTENIEAYEHFLKAETVRLGFQFHKFNEAIGNYRTAITLDPKYVAAYFSLALVLNDIWYSGIAEIMPDPALALVQAREALARIKVLEPDHLAANMLDIGFIVASGDLDTALKLAEDQASQHPTDFNAADMLAWTLMNMGRQDDALQAAERALSLSEGQDGMALFWLAYKFAFLGEAERAKVLVRRARSNGAGEYIVSWVLTMAHTQLGDPEAANKSVKTLLGGWPAANWTFQRVVLRQYRGPEAEERFIGALAKAGLPEWPMGFTFDEAKRVRGAELAALFKPPYKIDGGIYVPGQPYEGSRKKPTALTEWPYEIKGIGFTFREVKDDLLCIDSPASPMVRPYCMPVYRDPVYIQEHSNTSHTYITPEIHYGVLLFSVNRE